MGPHYETSTLIKLLTGGTFLGRKERNSGRTASRNYCGVPRFIGRGSRNRPVHHHFRRTSIRDPVQFHGEYPIDWRSRVRQSHPIFAPHYVAWPALTLPRGSKG